MIYRLTKKFLTHIRPFSHPAATRLVTTDSGRHARAKRAAVKTAQQLRAMIYAASPDEEHGHDGVSGTNDLDRQWPVAE